VPFFAKADEMKKLVAAGIHNEKKFFIRRRKMKRKNYFRQIVFCVVLLIPLTGAAQTTEFSYQGRLLDGAAPANANYDFEFHLFGVETGGTAIGAQARPGVAVANGIFTVKLDFGLQFQDGSVRWLQVSVKSAGSPNPFTILSPRQAFTSAPYAIQSLNATNALQLGGTAASQFVLTTDARLSDARNPLPNSADYVQNRTTPQAATNFNISGDGTSGGALSGNILRANSHFVIGGIGGIGGQRVLSTGGSANLFVGINAGAANTTGIQNAFFGASAGTANTSGNSNLFIGAFAGNSNTTGSNNTTIGIGADVASNNLSFATAIGSGATVSASNTIQLGRANGSDSVRIPGDLFVSGSLSVVTLGDEGVTQLCRAPFIERISRCSSSLRYKSNVNSFKSGLNLISRLRPVSFNWKTGNQPDIGLIAEEVAEVEPLLVTRDDKGEIEGVKYDRLGAVLVNAVNEQQSEIKQLKEQIQLQQRQIETLKSLVCQTNPQADVCQ
jgi:hypothetical protein